jgi:hypothetical protein
MFGLGDPALDVARLLQREALSFEPHQVDSWLDTYLRFVDQPAMAERIDLFRRLLEVHNVIYLVVGLQQHTTTQLESELRDAVPYMQAALSTAIDHATAALKLPAIADPQSLVADFFAWLLEATPATG